MQTHVLEWLDRSAAAHPGKVALVDERGSLTFQELSRRARGVAAQIAARTTAQRVPIAVYLPKSADAIVAFLGILASGNIYVPLDVKSPAARTRKILENLEPALVLCGDEAFDGFETLRLDGSAVDGGALTPEGIIDTDPAYIIYTSGSTGVPKGVAIAQRGIIDYIDWAIATFDVTSDATIGNQSPLFFDNSTLDLYLSLATGATLVLIPEGLFAFPVRLMEYVAAREISFIFWVPSVMIGVANLDILRAVPLPRLTKILFAGEVMPNRQLNHWRRHLPQALFANLYGPTEITVDCTYYIVDREFADHEPLPIGFPCRNTGILVLDEDDRPAQGSDPGELCVRGSSLALGYWNAPDKTAAAFVQNPLNPHVPERIYRTGDLVARNSRGELLFLGRKDSQIKHHGHRIELGEIELAAAGVAAIRHACALYDGRDLWLFYEAAEDLTPATLRKELGVSLPKYMLPTKFQRMEELPKNANGKIDRLALAGALT